MPSKTVTIDFTLPTYFNVASFFAVLAYPEKEEVERKFRNQLCIFCLEELAGYEQLPYVVETPLSVFQSKMEPAFFAQGIKKLHQRFGVGFHIILRQAQIYDKKDYTRKTTELLGTLIDDLGNENISTAKTKIWKPTWPVFHAAAIFAYMGIFSYYDVREFDAEKLDFKDFDLSRIKNIVFKSMMRENEELSLVDGAEQIRSRVLEKKTYKQIGENNTIQFQLTNASASKCGFANAASGIHKFKGSWKRK